MNPYERFFRLLFSLLSLVVRGVTTLEWVNDCLQVMADAPMPEAIPIPSRPYPVSRGFSPKKKRLKRRVANWELKPEDWKRVLDFCRDFNPRFLPLAEYFHANSNTPTTRKVLREKGFIFRPFAITDFHNGINTPLAKAGIHYSLRMRNRANPRNHDDWWGNDEMQFCVLRVLD